MQAPSPNPCLQTSPAFRPYGRAPRQQPQHCQLRPGTRGSSSLSRKPSPLSCLRAGQTRPFEQEFVACILGSFC